VKRAGNAIRLPHFTPTRLNNLRSVNHLLQSFYALDMCCAITGNYPAYIADVFNSYHRMRLHTARTDSPILDSIYRNFHAFEIGPFVFGQTEWLEYKNFPNYSIYKITHEYVTITVHITNVDVSAYCGYRSNINLAKFIWKYV